MEYFDLLLKPFKWAITNVLMYSKLQIDNIPIWILLIAAISMTVLIVGIFHSNGSIYIPRTGSSQPPSTSKATNNNHYVDTAANNRFNDYVRNLEYWK